MGLEGEQRPQDAAGEIGRTLAEAAEMAEHIRDSEPRHTREAQFDQLIAILDDSHELALRTEMDLKPSMADAEDDATGAPEPLKAATAVACRPTRSLKPPAVFWQRMSGSNPHGYECEKCGSVVTVPPCRGAIFLSKHGVYP